MSYISFLSLSMLFLLPVTLQRWWRRCHHLLQWQFHLPMKVRTLPQHSWLVSSVHPSIHAFFPSVYPLIHLFIYLPINSSIHPCMHLILHPSIHPFFLPPVRLPIGPHIHLSTHLFIHAPVHACTYLSCIHLYHHIFVICNVINKTIIIILMLWLTNDK